MYLGSGTFADLTLTPVTLNNDTVYAFDLPNGQHGYTVDNPGVIFHVYDDATNSYTDYGASDSVDLGSSSISSNNNGSNNANNNSGNVLQYLNPVTSFQVATGSTIGNIVLFAALSLGVILIAKNI